MGYVLICSITLIVLLIIKFSRKPPGFPPGPPRIPVIGNMPQKKGIALQQNISDMVEKYGDTIGAYAGNTPLIWLHDPKTIRKLFNMEQFSGKFSFSFFELSKWMCNS